jgi:hypothetical protein
MRCWEGSVIAEGERARLEAKNKKLFSCYAVASALTYSSPERTYLAGTLVDYALLPPPPIP